MKFYYNISCDKVWLKPYFIPTYFATISFYIFEKFFGYRRIEWDHC